MGNNILDEMLVYFMSLKFSTCKYNNSTCKYNNSTWIEVDLDEVYGIQSRDY